MHITSLLEILSSTLKPNEVKDFCPNGLQVEGTENINKIVTGVTASQALVDKAVESDADAILVHHGYFWKNEPYPIVGMKKKRISTLLKHNINLIAYHLPLDVHPTLGNNAQLGKLLNLNQVDAVPNIAPEGIVMYGEFSTAMKHEELNAFLKDTFGRDVISVNANDSIRTIAWCTGGGQGYIDNAIMALTAAGVRLDAFLSGEISEQTTHSAREQEVGYYAIGHHASERYGVKALGEFLSNEHALDVEFIDIGQSSMSDSNFDGIAKKFDENIYGTSKGQVRHALLCHYLKPLLSSSTLKVVDLGAGTGHMAFEFASKGHHCDLYDVSEEALAIAKSKLSAMDSVYYQQKSLFDWKGTQDVILCHAVLEWLPNPKDAILHIANNMKEGAILSLSFFNHHAMLFNNALYGNFDYIKKGMKVRNQVRLNPHHPQKPDSVLQWIQESPKMEIMQTAGIRCFHDYMYDRESLEDNMSNILQLEKQYGMEFPYKYLAKYFHVLAKKVN